MEQRAEEAVISAKEHLEERNEEPPSIVSGSVVSSRQSLKARTHKSLDRACELRRQAAEFASLKIDQAKEEAARRECRKKMSNESLRKCWKQQQNKRNAFIRVKRDVGYNI